MSLTQHLGYGRFHLEDLLPDEAFARFDGSLARVCAHQPYRHPQPHCNHPYLPDHVLVWIHAGTSNAQQVLLHRTAVVHALSREQAEEIAGRLLRRKEGIP